jgi:hypothetical protein
MIIFYQSVRYRFRFLPGSGLPGVFARAGAGIIPVCPLKKREDLRASFFGKVLS